MKQIVLTACLLIGLIQASYGLSLPQREPILQKYRANIESIALPRNIKDIPKYRNQVIDQMIVIVNKIHDDLDAANYRLWEEKNRQRDKGSNGDKYENIVSYDAYIRELQLTREECRLEKQRKPVCPPVEPICEPKPICGPHEKLSPIPVQRGSPCEMWKCVPIMPGPRTACSMDGFSEALYLAENPDVAAAVKKGDFVSGRQHYDQLGYKENRSGGLCGSSILGCTEEFNESRYLAENKDVAEAVKKGKFVSGRHHYDFWGYKENRSGIPCKDFCHEKGTSKKRSMGRSCFDRGLVPRSFSDQVIETRPFGDVEGQVIKQRMLESSQ
jgi:hypothetical protein